MLAYYLRDALRSMRRNPALTSLVVAAIAVGIGVSITMLTFYHVMSGDPIPDKSDVLFRVQLDSWGPNRPFNTNHPKRPPIQMTWQDVQALLADARGKRQEASFTSTMVVTPDNTSQLPFEIGTRLTTADFFPMFEVPFLYGGGWDKRADANAEQVIVLSRKTNEKLFGGADSVGKVISVNDRKFTVVGVMDTWSPMPRFYDVVEGPYNEVSDAFAPLSLTPGMKLNSSGSDWGWKPEPIKTFEDWLNSESVWLQYWVELDSPDDAAAYKSYLDAYVNGQKKLGRFQRPLNNQIHNVMGWMDYNQVVQSDVSVLVGLGFLFLMVCLLSSISLLLTKFNGKTPEMSLRRALGASRFNIINQNLVEVGMIGAVGGFLGIGLTLIALRAIHAGLDQAPAALFRLDGTMLVTALLVAVATSLIAGVYPALKTCALMPAQQLKTQ